MPSLTIYRSGSAPQCFELNDPEISLGRDAGNGICIEDDHISGVHARLTEEPDGSYSLTDHGSSNGTSLNGKPLSNSILRDGDRITFGVYVRALYQNRPATAASAAARSHRPAESASRIVAHRPTTSMSATTSPSASGAAVLPPPSSAATKAAAPQALLQTAQASPGSEPDEVQEMRMLQVKTQAMRREQQQIAAKLQEGRARLAQISQEISTTEQLNLQSESDYQNLQSQIEQAREELRNTEDLQRVQAHTLAQNKARIQQIIQEKQTIDTRIAEARQLAETEAASTSGKLEEANAAYQKRQKELAALVRTIEIKKAAAEEQPENEEQAKKRKELEARLKESLGAVELLNKQKNSLSEQLTRTREEASSREQNLKKETEALKNAARDFEKQLTGKDDALAKAKAELESARKRADNLENRTEEEIARHASERQAEIDTEIKTRKESIDSLNRQWEKDKAELGDARERLKEQISEKQEELDRISRELESRKSGTVALEEDKDDPTASPRRKRLRIEIPPRRTGPTASPSILPPPGASIAAGGARLSEVEETLRKKQAFLDQKTSEIEAAEEQLQKTLAEVQEATEDLQRTQKNASGRYVPPPPPPTAFAPSPLHPTLPLPEPSPFASAALGDDQSPEDEHLRLEVLLPDPDCQEQAFPEGAGSPDFYLHPPIGLHALAACTHGSLSSADALPVRRDDASPASSPVLLVLGGDFESASDKIQTVLNLNHGRPRLAAIQSPAFDDFARDFEKGTNFQRFAKLLSRFDGVVTTDPESARLVDSLANAPRHLNLDMPYPVDVADWEFSISIDKRVSGLFLSTDGFDADRPEHAALVQFVNRLAGAHQVPVTLYGHRNSDTPAGLDVPGELLTRPGKALNYNRYISLAAPHRLIAGFGPNFVGGDLWGDALLCRSLYLGPASAPADQLFPATCGAFNNQGEAAIDSVVELLRDDQACRDQIERSQWLALEKLSFKTACERLEQFVESIPSPGSTPTTMPSVPLTLPAAG